MRRHLLRLTILLIGILWQFDQLCLPSFNGINAVAQTKASTKHIAIKCGKLIDGTLPNAISDAVILISGDRIAAAGRGIKIPADAEVIDLSRATVLPGLIDSHTHLTYHYDT